MTRDLSGAQWRKSSRSQEQGACVELAKLPGIVAIRDSKNPAGGALVLGREAFASLLTQLRG